MTRFLDNWFRVLSLVHSYVLFTTCFDMIFSSLELLHFVAIHGTGLLHIQFYHGLDIFLT